MFAYKSDEQTELLVNLTRNTCLLALDRVLTEIGRIKSYKESTEYLLKVSQRMTTSVKEVGHCSKQLGTR